jgi:hypothetical protein
LRFFPIGALYLPTCLNFIAGMSVAFVGNGEGKENLHLFDRDHYVAALFQDDGSCS